MMNKNEPGIYIHIPFCMQKCLYCDFLSGPADDDIKSQYFKALEKEINMRAEKLNLTPDNTLVKTVFFGGGTPTAVNESFIVRIMEILRNNFHIAAEAEISIECNPGTLTQDKALAYRNCGINRISFGLQTTDDELLKIIGRIHNFRQFEESFETAKKAGFNNINVDIMQALPGQTLSGYIDGLKRVVSFNPSHISAYSLIVEEGTYLCDNLSQFPKLPDEDTERRMYHETCRILRKAGYEQYEISNFSHPQMECRHNLSYWERKDYLGFGIGAASLYKDTRTTNTGDLKKYIEILNMQGNIFESVTELSKQDMMEEFMYLGLRKTNGISFADFKENFGVYIKTVYGDVIDKYVKLGLLELCGLDSCNESCGYAAGCRLTERGIDVSNIVLAEFLL